MERAPFRSDPTHLKTFRVIAVALGVWVIIDCTVSLFDPSYGTPRDIVQGIIGIGMGCFALKIGITGEYETFEGFRALRTRARDAEEVRLIQNSLKTTTDTAEH